MAVRVQELAACGSNSTGRPIAWANSTMWFGAQLEWPPTDTPSSARRGRRAATAPRKHWRCRRSALAPLCGLRTRFSTVHNEPPIPPSCPSCSQIMRLARPASRFGDLPDLCTFECRACGVLYTEARAERRCETGADCNYNEVLCSPSLYSAISVLSPFHQ
jgi:hypothetical protein